MSMTSPSGAYYGKCRELFLSKAYALGFPYQIQYSGHSSVLIKPEYMSLIDGKKSEQAKNAFIAVAEESFIRKYILKRCFDNDKSKEENIEEYRHIYDANINACMKLCGMCRDDFRTLLESVYQECWYKTKPDFPVRQSFTMGEYSMTFAERLGAELNCASDLGYSLADAQPKKEPPYHKSRKIKFGDIWL